MRWKAVMVLAMVGAAVAGCKETCFLTEGDYNHYSNLGLPPNLENEPAATVLPGLCSGPTPATVDNPEREVRHLSLAEALALALEHGTGGSPALNGTTNDTLLSLQGGSALSPEPPLRVLALQPALAGSDIEAALSKFDARWTTSMTWQRIDEPLGNNILNDFNNGDHAQFQTSLLKPLPTGGVAGITFNTQYTLLSSPPTGITNPAYRPSLQFQFEQPLLQGFGVEINQLRATHPGSLLTPFNNSSRVEGILITRTRFDQQRADFQRLVNTLLLNVEVAYWNLYGAYWNLYSREQALRQSYQAWRINTVRFEAGKATVIDVSQARGQFESFRGQRLQALGQVLENEHQLRGLVGLPVEDGTRLVPSDEPTLSAFLPDWNTALDEALAQRPELALARQDLKLRQLDLINQKNLLLPDLRFTSTYNLNGLGTHLDGGGNDPNNAFGDLASNQFHDWSLGLRLDVPIGFRDANAAVRSAQLRLTQSYLTLREEEYRTQRFLDEQYRALVQSYQQIQAQRAQREAQAIQLQGRFKELSAGKGTLDFLLEAQRFWADALTGEYQAIVDYNNALARFEFAKGTILERDNVMIAEGPLPACATVRAVEHEQERTKALVLRERARPVNHPCYASPEGPLAGVPELPSSGAVSLPALLGGQPLLSDPPGPAPASGPVSLGSPIAFGSPGGPADPAAEGLAQASLGQPVPVPEQAEAPDQPQAAPLPVSLAAPVVADQAPVVAAPAPDGWKPANGPEGAVLPAGYRGEAGSFQWQQPVVAP